MQRKSVCPGGRRTTGQYQPQDGISSLSFRGEIPAFRIPGVEGGRLDAEGFRGPPCPLDPTPVRSRSVARIMRRSASASVECPASLPCGTIGSWRRSVSPAEVITPRSMTLRSSRMFPGQGYRSSATRTPLGTLRSRMRTFPSDTSTSAPRASGCPPVARGAGGS